MIPPRPRCTCDPVGSGPQCTGDCAQWCADGQWHRVQRVVMPQAWVAWAVCGRCGKALPWLQLRKDSHVDAV